MSQENPNSASPTGKETDEALTVGEIERATERAFKYQRYIARRTFGLYYLAWAAAILFVVGSPNLMTLVGLSGALGETFQLIVRLMALAGAASITAVIFRDARRILMVRRASRQREMDLLPLCWWVDSLDVRGRIGVRGRIVVLSYASFTVLSWACLLQRCLLRPSAANTLPSLPPDEFGVP